MRVLVCGGRSFFNYEVVEKYLDMLHAIHRFDLVIHGAQHGADALADKWGKSRHIDVLPFKADWNGLGRAAGPIRNTQMIREGKPNLVVAFPGNRGTRNMRQQASEAQLLVLDLSIQSVRSLITEQWKAISRVS